MFNKIFYNLTLKIKQYSATKNAFKIGSAPINYSKFNCVKFYSTEKSGIKDMKCIYYGVLTPQIKAVKLFSLSSSFIGLVGQPFLYNTLMSTGNIPIIISVYSFFGFFTFITPLLLHVVTKKYVTHLEYDSSTDSYTAKTINFFCVPKTTEFKVDDVKVPDVPGMFTTLLACGKPLFFDPRLFEKPDHYSRLMGFDKPIDYKLYNPTSINKDK